MELLKIQEINRTLAELSKYSSQFNGFLILDRFNSSPGRDIQDYGGKRILSSKTDGGATRRMVRE